MRIWRPKDFDICECGDYRHQHKTMTTQDRQVGCTLCTCFVFRLFQRVVWESVHD